jgi:hypothetical protein
MVCLSFDGVCEQICSAPNGRLNKKVRIQVPLRFQLLRKSCIDFPGFRSCSVDMDFLRVSPSCADCLEIWEPEPHGTLKACPGLCWDCFTLTLTFNTK